MLFRSTILSYLIDPSKGGTGFTNFVGHWAARAGYDGVLFFGARALTARPELRTWIETGADSGLMPIAPGHFAAMRRDDSLKNLVIFSGAHLTAKVRSFQLRPAPAQVNPYCGAGAAEIDAVVDFKTSYQEEQSEKGFYLAHPFDVTREP